jgi:uncharacterized protein YuzE
VRVHVDQDADALYVCLDDSPIVESKEVHPGVVLDFNEDNQVVGIEVLKVSDRIPSANLRQIQFEVA